MGQQDQPPSPRDTEPDPASPAAAPRRRQPSQARGQQRVDAILDAVSPLVVRDGIANVTMHTVARQAQTSVGSMYHFFPDREHLLDALAQRHEQALADIAQTFDGVTLDSWTAMQPQALFQFLTRPYTEYLVRNVDVLPVLHHQLIPGNDEGFIRLLMAILSARLPHTPQAQLERHAAVVQSTAAGLLMFAYRMDGANIDFYLKEMPRVLGAYLVHLHALDAALAAGRQDTAQADAQKDAAGSP